jgi:hypothetical protein
VTVWSFEITYPDGFGIVSSTMCELTIFEVFLDGIALWLGPLGLLLRFYCAAGLIFA